jgi:CubicO group peptidase (beta-lactamase class C family)
MLAFERTQTRVQYELEVDTLTCGAQIVVEQRGARVLDLAVGDAGTGEALTNETVFRVYCTLKPVTAIAIAKLVEASVLDLDEPLASDLPDVACLRDGVTLRHVLTHTAGLDLVRGIELESLPAARRRAHLARVPRKLGPRPGSDPAYSEAIAWHVLGWLIEESTGDQLRDHLRREVLDPLGLESTWIGMTPGEYADVFPQLGINIDNRHYSRLPLLYERSERVCTDTNPAFGGYTTAADLATFYTAVLDQLEDNRSAGLPSAQQTRMFASPAAPIRFDRVLDRECGFGLGFMTDLRDHQFGSECGSSSFGHSGYVGSSFAFADPERQLAVSVIFNGILTHESAFMRRRAILRSLYADLDDRLESQELGTDSSDQPQISTNRSIRRRPSLFRRGQNS